MHGSAVDVAAEFARVRCEFADVIRKRSAKNLTSAMKFDVTRHMANGRIMLASSQRAMYATPPKRKRCEKSTDIIKTWDISIT
jgi:hypothetical protein